MKAFVFRLLMGTLLIQFAASFRVLGSCNGPACWDRPAESLIASAVTALQREWIKLVDVRWKPISVFPEHVLQKQNQ
jgi:hypothetical protein